MTNSNTLQMFPFPTSRVVAVNPDGSLASVPTLSVSGQYPSLSGGNTVTLPTAAPANSWY